MNILKLEMNDDDNNEIENVNWIKHKHKLKI